MGLVLADERARRARRAAPELAAIKSTHRRQLACNYMTIAVFGHLFRLLEAGQSWVWECVTLLMAPFVHEDVAILGASLLVVEHRLPVALALLSVFAGMILSDFALFGAGALARRHNRLQRLLVTRGAMHSQEWLSTHAFPAVAAARFVPGLIFPVYVGCGLAGVSMWRFAVATVTTAIIYLPVAFVFATTFGRAVMANIGHWSWIFVPGILAAAATGWMRPPRWGWFLRMLSRGCRDVVGQRFARIGISHRGMPTLADLANSVALAERIPPVAFYLPLGIQWLWLSFVHRNLSLPALADPLVEVGGLWGESKNAYLAMVGEGQKPWLASYAAVTRGNCREKDLARADRVMKGAGLGYPLVVKPDIGWRGFGVRLVQTPDELEDYMRAFPEDETIILQRPVPFDGEAGVLYARMPCEERGRIISLTFRYFPHVVGDGKRTVRDLIPSDQRATWKAGKHLGLDRKHLGAPSSELDRIPAPGETARLCFIGSNRVGGLYRDAREHITKALSDRFDEISRSMPEFYYGRYDIRFSSVEELRCGKGFSVIEINGAGGESINVWDPDMPLRQVYKELFAQQRLLFEIGACNKARGFRSAGALAVLRSQWRQYRLILRYPPSG